MLIMYYDTIAMLSIHMVHAAYKAAAYGSFAKRDE